MIAALFFTLFGGFLTWNAVANWRYRHEEKVSLLEASILKTTGIEPLPLTKFDRCLQWLQMVTAMVLGPILLLAGIAGFALEIGILK